MGSVSTHEPYKVPVVLRSHPRCRIIILVTVSRTGSGLRSVGGDWGEELFRIISRPFLEMNRTFLDLFVIVNIIEFR